MTPTANIHASCVVLDRAGAPFGAPKKAGILILGESGAGKSTLVLQLLAAGAGLVADDRVQLSVQRGKLIARAPQPIAGLLEVRRLGIVELPYRAQATVSLVVRLGKNAAPRLPEPAFYDPPKRLKLPVAQRPPLITASVTDVSAALKISLAAAAFARRLFRNSPHPI